MNVSEHLSIKTRVEWSNVVFVPVKIYPFLLSQRVLGWLRKQAGASDRSAIEASYT